MDFETQVRERVEAVLSGDTKPEEIPGATSVRCAIGLVLRSLEGITTLSENAAWDYLDSGNVTITQHLRSENWDKVDEWRKLYEAEKATIAEAEEARKKAARDASMKAYNDEWNALFDEIATQNATQAKLLTVDGNVA
ncbi:MAG: hypothetical protein ACRECW_06420 [Phyllobacterium sp.]